MEDLGHFVKIMYTTRDCFNNLHFWAHSLNFNLGNGLFPDHLPDQGGLKPRFDRMILYIIILPNVHIIPMLICLPVSQALYQQKQSHILCCWIPAVCCGNSKSSIYWHLWWSLGLSAGNIFNFNIYTTYTEKVGVLTKIY